MVVRSYSFHVFHQYTLHVIIIGDETTHRMCLVGQCCAVEQVRVIGTGGEQALVDAFKHEFPYAQHLTCFVYVRRNMKMKLQDCNIPASQCRYSK